MAAFIRDEIRAASVIPAPSVCGYIPRGREWICSRIERGQRCNARAKERERERESVDEKGEGGKQCRPVRCLCSGVPIHVGVYINERARES